MKNQLRLFIRETGVYPEKLGIPEVSNGFDMALPPLPSGMVPMSYWSEPVPAGIYRVRIRLKATEDIKELYLFTGRKQLREILSMKCGECLEREYGLSVMEIIPRFQENSCPTEHLFFTLCSDRPGAVQVEAEWELAEERISRIFLCGDSTVTDHASELPYHPGACYAAWGQDMAAFLEGSFAVENQAHCGLTTEAFRQEGHFDIVKRWIRKGDMAVFQFGHNDQKLPHLLADQAYPDNLRRFVEEIRQTGAAPVLVTPLGRNIWSRDGRYLDLLKEHAQAVGQVAEKEQVPWIDLHGFSVDFICKKGMERARGYFHPGDYTHTNEYGACVFGEYMAERLAELFPETLRARKAAVEFLPPDGLWERLESERQRSAVGSRNLPASQRGRFDSMEKSTAELLRVIEEARKSGGNRKNL